VNPISSDLSHPSEQPIMDNPEMIEFWTIEGAREELEVMIQKVEVDIVNLQAALENKDKKAVAKSLTLAQFTVAAALDARETFGDHLIAAKRIVEFQEEKIAQRNLHKRFFFLQKDAEKFLVAAVKNGAGKRETRPGGGDIGHGVAINRGYGPTPTTTCQIDEELALQQEGGKIKKRKNEHECDDDDVKQCPSSAAAKDEIVSGGGSNEEEDWDNIGDGPTLTTTCQNSDDELALRHEDDGDGVKQIPSSISTARNQPQSGYAATFEITLLNLELIQFSPCMKTGQLENEYKKTAMGAEPDARSHQHNNSNALPREPSDFENGDVDGKLPPHFSTAKIKDPPPGGGATKYENTGGGIKGSVPANLKTSSEPTTAILLNSEKEKCGWCLKEHPKIMCHDPRGQEGGKKNHDDAEQASKTTASGVNPQPGKVENPDVPLLEFLQDELQFPKNEDEVVVHQQYGGTTTRQQHHEVVKLCASRAMKLLNPEWWNGPLRLYSPPAQPFVTVGDTVGARKEAEKEMWKSLATSMVADPHRPIEIKILEEEEIATSPLILLDDDEFVERHVRYLHEEACHVGAQMLLGKIRRKIFWLLSEQRAVKKIVNDCWTGRLFNAKRAEVAEPPLPIANTGAGVRLKIVGVGVASPLLLKNKKQAAHCKELDALLFEVELSKRPLTDMKENTDDPMPLTPNMVVSNSGLFLEADIRDAVATQAAHRRTQRLKEVLHSRFRKECHLSHLTTQVAAKPDNAVLVVNKNGRGWSLGAIVEANPGKDCAIWTNKVKTWAGIVTRPTQ